MWYLLQILSKFKEKRQKHARSEIHNGGKTEEPVTFAITVENLFQPDS